MKRRYENKGCLLFSLFVLALLSLPVFSWAGGSNTPSGVTAQTIIDRVRRDLNESSSSDAFWANDDILQWVDESVREIVNRTRCLESGSSTFTVHESQYQYDIPITSGATFLDIEVVLHDSGVTDPRPQIVALERQDIRMYGRGKLSGRPQAFTIWNNDLYIYPIPEPEYSGTTLIAFMVSAPSGVTSTSSPIETPAYFDFAILHYIKAKALLKDGMIDSATKYLNLYYGMINSYIANVMGKEVATQTER